MQFLQFIAIATGLLGHWFISNQDVRGYYVWIVGNVAMIVLQWQVGLYGMVLLFVIYTVISVIGIKKWQRNVLLTKEKVSVNE